MNRCERTTIIDAWHDGRLGEPEEASIERHVATCPACADRRRVLGAIREAVRAPRPEATPLAHHRARGELLRRAADASAKSQPTSTVRVRLATFAVAAVFVVAALFAGWSWGRSSAPVASASVAPSASGTPAETSVVPASGARFERARRDGLDLVTLSDGSLAISIGTVDAKERFVVRTSDAEIEAKESAFRIDADAGKIRSVAVERGMVEVRYAGFFAAIPAGGSWRAADAHAEASPPASSTPAAAPPPGASSPSARPSAVVADSTPPRAASPRRPTPIAAVATPTSAPALVASADASHELAPPPAPRNTFSDAMRALERGDYGGAASTFTDFSASHPDDARADDADYMHAIALQRAGRTDESKAAARAYLSKWPHGAHRTQVEIIAND